MSGFEIAGLALGVFPLLLGSAKKARVLFEGTKMWWRFETEFDDFISAVEREYIAFSQIIEILLAPLDISDDDQEKLQNDPDSSLWHQPDIQAALRRRIQSRYHEWFMTQLNDIINAVTELHELLPIDKVYLMSSDNIESTMFRVKTSFSQKKSRLISKVRVGNERLYEFLDRAAHVVQTNPQPKPKSSERSRLFLERQKAASAVLACFEKSWVCSCGLGHPCGAAVLDGGGDEATTEQLTVLFTHGTERTQLRVEVCASPADKTAGRDAPRARHGEIAQLKQQISIRNRLKEAKSKGIFALAVSALSITSPGSGSGNGLELEKPQAKLKKPSPFGRLMGRGKLQPPEPPQPPPAAPVTSRSDSTDSEDEEVQASPETRKVRFVETPPSATSSLSQEHRDAKAIEDMCLAASGQLKGPHPGFIKIDRQRWALFHLDPPNQEQLQQWEAESLEAFLKSTPRRDTRLRVGLSMILTVLNLGASSWIPALWSKKELLLLRKSDTPVPLLYMSHSSVHSLLKEQPSTSSDMVRRTKQSLLSLGILLMELIFRDTLELQPFRDEFMGATGQPNEMTNLCTAVRWHQRVEEDFGDGLSEAIRRCLMCAFDPIPDLSSVQFVQAVFQNVVWPVEQFLSAWGTSPTKARES
ncbi:hypothetical protein AK830_g5088 [Neonectria ditissima]|uniref:DUF7580 domain-containing protein n=1 Tax=Neonectria ditissima TaxID=78410 RepID=A0A0P7BF03_9HYPO|nr:hypothetical protein AK830_g5088 [Neonectria ditissima]